MKLSKAIEILQINVSQRSPSMPPDVKDALKLSIQACKFIQTFKDTEDIEPLTSLIGEAPE